MHLVYTCVFELFCWCVWLRHFFFPTNIYGSFILQKFLNSHFFTINFCLPGRHSTQEQTSRKRGRTIAQQLSESPKRKLILHTHTHTALDLCRPKPKFSAKSAPSERTGIIMSFSRREPRACVAFRNRRHWPTLSCSLSCYIYLYIYIYSPIFDFLPVIYNVLFWEQSLNLHSAL